MKKFSLFVLFFCVNFYSSLQNQDLCAAAKAKGLTFANDPSSCDGYLYCKTAADGTVEEVVQLSCKDDYPTSPNFFEDGCYSNDPATNGISCTATFGTDPAAIDTNPDYVIDLCPGSPNLQASSIMYADPADTTCQKYYFCKEVTPRADPLVAVPVGSALTCSGTLVFDRNSGRCVLPEKAPCKSSPGVTPGQCPSGSGLVLVPVANSCTGYIICVDGAKVGENDCGPDLVFNPNVSQCDLPASWTCPYTAKRMESLASIPRAQPKSRKNNPLIGELRNRIFMGRQLKF